MSKKKKDDPIDPNASKMARLLASSAVTNIRKAHGGTALIQASEVKMRKVQRYRTGIFPLDFSLGGGVPRGMITLIYGPPSGSKTTTANRIIAEAQRVCAVCCQGDYNTRTCECTAAKGKNKGQFEETVAAFVDVEGTYDVPWAVRLGVDDSRLLLSQPEYAEQALDIAEALIRSGDVDVLVLDSIAFLVPSKEIEESTEKALVGEQARLVGRGIRKIVSALNAVEREKGRRPTVILINQIRMKVGVMFGCFHYNARVVLADGTTEKIGKIVNQKLPVEVLSFDPETNECVPRKVVGWFNNGKAERFLQFVTEKAGGNGRSQFGVTENHIIFTPEGERRAGDIQIGDFVLGRALEQFTEVQKDLVIGSILGAGSLRKTGVHTVQARFAHGADQVDYARWKAEVFGDLVEWSGPTGHNGWGFDLRPSADLLTLERSCYERAEGQVSRRISQELLSALSLRAVAVWYADDGSFSGHYTQWGHGKAEIPVKKYSQPDVERLADRLEELGLPRPSTTTPGRLRWSGEACAAFQEAIASFVPPCMDYKLHPSLRGRFEEWPEEERKDRYRMIPVRVVDVYEKPPTKCMDRYDLEVEGTHAYLVDGVGVHNSPETLPGGEAQKYAAAVIIKVRGGKVEVPDSGLSVPLEADMFFRVEKNKTAPPRSEGEYKLVLADTETKRMGDVDDDRQIIKIAEQAGLLTGGGSSWTCFGEKYKGKKELELKIATDREFKSAFTNQLLNTLTAMGLCGGVPDGDAAEVLGGDTLLASIPEE